MEETLDASPRSELEPEMRALGWQHTLSDSSTVQLTLAPLRYCLYSEAERTQAEGQLDHSRWGGDGGHRESPGDSGFAHSALCKASMAFSPGGYTCWVLLFISDFPSKGRITLEGPGCSSGSDSLSPALSLDPDASSWPCPSPWSPFVWRILLPCS